MHKATPPSWWRKSTSNPRPHNPALKLPLLHRRRARAESVNLRDVDLCAFMQPSTKNKIMTIITRWGGIALPHAACAPHAT